MKKMLVFISLLLLACSLPEPADIIPPVVRVIFPYEGAVISDNVQFTVEASDDDQVESVWIYVDGEEVGRTSTAPYKVNFNIQGYEKKIPHVMLAAARDKEGNIGFSPTVTFVIADGEDNVDPTVVILNPQSGQTVEGIVNVVAHADDDRSVQEVRFYIDGQQVHSTSDYPYIYNWNTTGYSDSTSHTIYAEAIDGGNNNAFSPVVTVTVYPRTGSAADNLPPRALFLYPIAGSTVKGTINVSVDLQDNVKVAKAEFFVDGILTNSVTDPASPWVFQWNTATVADTVPTTHSLYVKAYDEAGNLGTSGLIVITVTQ
ncbi:Ig-like domain-containing protein [Caldithrix abyssi]